QQQQQPQQFGVQNNQQAQQLYNQIGQQMGLYDSFNPILWSDMNTVAGANTCFLGDPQFAGRNMLIDQSSNSPNIGSGNDANHNNSNGIMSPAATTSVATSTVGISNNVGNNNNSSILNGFLSNGMYSNTGSPFNSNQQQRQQQQLNTADTSGMFMHLKVEPTDSPLTSVSGGGPMDEELSADQVQALLEQTIAAANNTRNINSNNNSNMNNINGSNNNHHINGNNNYNHQQQIFRHQLVPNHSLELSGVQDGFHSTNWPGMM
ncbi:hypothetical protein BGX26_011802, partial [Mortierella sp. AD094]